MNLLILIVPLAGLVALAGGWLGCQFLRQNGQLLLRIEEPEKRLDGWEFGETDSQPTSANTNGDDRASRFSNASLARSKIKRDGLKAGTPAPGFRLPRLDGHGELGLEDLRGRRALLVFSSPHCGPCNELAPALEKFHREQVGPRHFVRATQR